MTYRRPPLPDLDPPVAFGGHSFRHLDGGSVPLLRCTRCHGVLAVHELVEGFVAVRLGAWCPDALVALDA